MAPDARRGSRRRCSSAWVRPSTSTPGLRLPGAAHGCSGRASSGPTGSLTSRADCGGATRATTRSSSRASRASTRAIDRPRAGPRRPLTAAEGHRASLISSLDDPFAEHYRRRRRRPRPGRAAAGALLRRPRAAGDRGRQRPAAPRTRSATGGCPSRRPAPRSCSTAYDGARPVRARRRRRPGPPHRDHPRDAVLLPHRDRHARHPPGARRPARGAAPRALADPALDDRPGDDGLRRRLPGQAPRLRDRGRRSSSPTLRSGSPPAASSRRSTACRASSAASALRSGEVAAGAVRRLRGADRADHPGPGRAGEDLDEHPALHELRAAQPPDDGLRAATTPTSSR